MSALHGREREQRVLRSLLERARAGQGGGLVLHGEAGIGKSALLADARSTAEGFEQLEAVGLERECDLPYATLHQLLLPVLDRANRLPEPQARALAKVFGRAEGATPDRFLVALAVLSLLSEVAGDRPVLCVVDDAHWADRSSLDALGFVSRRLAVEPIAVVLAARIGGSGTAPPGGLEELPVTGLGRRAAHAVLVDAGAHRLTPAEQEELLTASGGNPLAIREFARTGLRPDLAAPLPLAERLRSAFHTGIRGRDEATRRLLLLIAAAGAERCGTLRRAAVTLELDLAPLDSGLLDELVVDGGRPRFRHPLIRSAVYHDARLAERRAAHLALAEALRLEKHESDRRAWHLARAATDPDERVARELELAAERALLHAGPAAAASALDRAARLSISPEVRARRQVAAAAAWLQAGDTTHATELLDKLDVDPSLPSKVEDEIAELRAIIALRTGIPAEAVALISRIVPRAVREARDNAEELLLLLGEAGFVAGTPHVWSQIAAAVERLGRRPGKTGEPLARLLHSVHRVLSDGGDPSTKAIEGIEALETIEEPYTLVSAAGMLAVIGEIELARRLRTRAAHRARTLSAAGSLAWILVSRVIEELHAGQFRLAQAYAEEGHRLAEETGQPNTAWRHQSLLALLAAHQGKSDEAERLAGQALRAAAIRGLPDVAAWARHAVGLIDLASGRAEEALRRFEAILLPGSEPTRAALLVLPDLVEAAVHAGQPARATDAFARFTGWANSTGAPDLMALAARCRAMLADDNSAEPEFGAATELHARGHWPLEAARTQLLFGEHLRRRRRRADARAPLREALEGFTRLGATGWADRARAELRAAGQHSADPGRHALAALTAQELRIAMAISAGATNREVAAQLFLSPRTVDYHLRKVFNKLDIVNRAELIRIVVSSRDPQEARVG